MEKANLKFSKKEYELITNSDFILTKNRIIEKIYTLYGTLNEKYKVLLHEYTTCLPDEVFETAPKIYKGERYNNLPYVMLDYPRCFSKTNVFAIRSFFWWGNYFSITLQLSGKYLIRFADNVAYFINAPKNKDWFFGAHSSEWEHDFKKNNYTRFNELTNINSADLKNRQFIKIAKKLPLENWKLADDFFLREYNILLELICRNQLPNR